MARANPRVYNPYVVSDIDGSLSLNPRFGQFLGPPGGDMGWAGTQNDGSQRAGTKVFQDSIEISLGVGNNFVAVNGTLNRNHGTFRVTLDPAPPGHANTFDIWGYCPWQVFQSQLFTVGLDYDTEYNMTLTNLHDDGGPNETVAWFDVTALTLWKVPTKWVVAGGNC